MDTMNITAILSLLGSGIPLLISERVDPSRHDIGLLKSVLRQVLYPLANCCVVQTKRIEHVLSGLLSPRLTVVPNPIPVATYMADPGTVPSGDRWKIIAVGRLEAQKGFDLLIEAFAKIADRYPDWEVVIFGEGTRRRELQAQIDGKRLEKRILLAGLTPKIEIELSKAHIMAFPSRYEGFPNALAEGLAAGLPAVGFAGVSGVEDLIADGETGLLVQPERGVPCLAQALERLMADSSLRKKLGAEASNRMLAWRPDVVCQAWEAQLISVARA
jgi:glycosyltransferase involved in cell wall biosynthesis